MWHSYVIKIGRVLVAGYITTNITKTLHILISISITLAPSPLCY